MPIDLTSMILGMGQPQGMPGFTDPAEAALKKEEEERKRQQEEAKARAEAYMQAITQQAEAAKQEKIKAQQMVEDMITRQQDPERAAQIRQLRQQTPDMIAQQMHDQYFGPPAKSTLGKVGQGALQALAGFSRSVPDFRQAGLKQYMAQQNALTGEEGLDTRLQQSQLKTVADMQKVAAVQETAAQKRQLDERTLEIRQQQILLQNAAKEIDQRLLQGKYATDAERVELQRKQMEFKQKADGMSGLLNTLTRDPAVGLTVLSNPQAKQTMFSAYGIKPEDLPSLNAENVGAIMDAQRKNENNRDKTYSGERKTVDKDGNVSITQSNSSTIQSGGASPGGSPIVDAMRKMRMIPSDSPAYLQGQAPGNPMPRTAISAAPMAAPAPAKPPNPLEDQTLKIPIGNPMVPEQHPAKITLREQWKQAPLPARQAAVEAGLTQGLNSVEKSSGVWNDEKPQDVLVRMNISPRPKPNATQERSEQDRNAGARQALQLKDESAMGYVDRWNDKTLFDKFGALLNTNFREYRQRFGDSQPPEFSSQQGFSQLNREVVNQYVHAMTGAQMSAREVDRYLPQFVATWEGPRSAAIVGYIASMTAGFDRALAKLRLDDTALDSLPIADLMAGDNGWINQYAKALDAAREFRRKGNSREDAMKQAFAGKEYLQSPTALITEAFRLKAEKEGQKVDPVDGAKVRLRTGDMLWVPGRPGAADEDDVLSQWQKKHGRK